MQKYRMPFAWLLLIAMLVLSPAAYAETSIAVVDVQKLLTESKAAKSIQEQVQSQREAFLETLSKQEQELRQTEKELVEQKADLSAEEFAKKKKDFEEKFLSTQQMAQKQKRGLDEVTLKAMGQLEAKLYEEVQKIADESNYTLVLSRQYVVVGEKSIDITDDAMKNLNDSVSDIKLEKPSK